jgi:general transcription factor 3C polypeptide 5 (transcription factor C subunit 1)
MNPVVKEKLPEQIFSIVEYPGFVKNSGKAIETLGGEDAIDDAFRKEELGCLQLNYTPQDKFSHAINGDVINTSNLVVRPSLFLTYQLCITRKVNKRTKEVVSVDQDIVGLATKTCRFRSKLLNSYSSSCRLPVCSRSSRSSCQTCSRYPSLE